MYNENNKLYIKKKRHNFKHINIQISIPQKYQIYGWGKISIKEKSKYTFNH